jgi:DNA-binding response OmpR family regulator
MLAGSTSMLYVFGDYTLDTEQYELRQAGRLVPLEPRVVELLAYLVQHPGRTVPTEELLAHLYPNEFGWFSGISRSAKLR